ncbi:hypothetical protein D9619_011703 [Psilocybe cf. subviscida]|uniref:Transmembrane protein n=1 Tax=Psilocybe cf. subviscida TaxID=2480587 RepID=A0A8H5BSP7_9AGAR|nr:hypothetical protein D9619_011703 [Psilocybe cf. subviscida]
MPLLTTTIEDSAPVLVYSGSGGGDWTAGTSKADSSIDEYSQSSYMVTNVVNANVSFSFYGTGVQIYGAKRQQHGSFQITIDGLVYTPQNGASVNPVFQTALFSTVALNEGYHTVTMANLGAGLDIDFLTWQTPVGKTDEGLLTWTDQDTVSSFAYNPASAWGFSPTNAGMFSGGSAHVTQTAGAAVEVYIMWYSTTTILIESLVLGDAVAIFGPVGPNGAPYSVQLDDNPPTNFSANKQFYRPQTVLFQAGHLGGGAHKVRLVSQAWKNSTMQFAVDYAQVYTTQALTSNDKGLSTGAIVGMSLGTLAGLLALIFALFYCLRRKSPKFGKLSLPFNSTKETMNTIPTSFENRPISYDLPSPGSPLTGGSQQLLVVRPMQSTISSSSADHSTAGGPMSPDLLLSLDQNGPDSQLVTIPYTIDGKYRPDLQRAPQLMLPPHVANMDRDAAAVRRMEMREGYTQLSVSSSPARPVPTSVANATAAMSQDTHTSEGTVQSHEPGRLAPAMSPERRAASVPMSVSSAQSDLMAPPPQYQRSPAA